METQVKPDPEKAAALRLAMRRADKMLRRFYLEQMKRTAKAKRTAA